MTKEIEEILKALANSENVETIAKLTEAIGQTEEALKKKDEELMKSKETMIKYVLQSSGTKKDEGEEDKVEREHEETLDDLLERWANDPKGEYEKALNA